MAVSKECEYWVPAAVLSSLSRSERIALAEMAHANKTQTIRPDIDEDRLFLSFAVARCIHFDFRSVRVRR